MTNQEALALAAAAVKAETAIVPEVGVVLGSGLGAWAEGLDDLVRIPYAAIPEMPRSNVVGHAGNLCVGHASGVAVACLQGRVHLYEGHAMDRVVFGVRLLARLGCKAVLLTNAAGGINAAFAPGDLVRVRGGGRACVRWRRTGVLTVCVSTRRWR